MGKSGSSKLQHPPRTGKPHHPPRPHGDWLRQLPQTGRSSSGVIVREETPENRHSDIPTGSKIAYYLFNLTKTVSDPGGKVFIGYAARRKLEMGQLGALKSLRISSEDINDFPLHSDQRILPNLLRISNPDPHTSSYSNRGSYRSYYRSSYGPNPGYSECILDPLLHSSILPELCATGRFLKSEKSSGPSEVEIATPLRYVADRPWQLELRITLDTAKRPRKKPQFYRLTGSLKRGTEQKNWEDVEGILESGFLLLKGEISPISHPPFLRWIETLREQKEIRIPKDQGPFLVEKLLTDPIAPFVIWPKELDWEKVKGIPHPRVVFTPLHQTNAVQADETQPNEPKPAEIEPVEIKKDELSFIKFDLEFDYQYAVISKANEHQELMIDGLQQKIWLRDFDAEAEILRKLNRLIDPDLPLEQVEDNPSATSQVPFNQFISLATRFIELGWEVYAEKRKLQIPKDFGMIVSSGIDWFELQAKTTFDGIQVGLPELLKALKTGENLIELGDGTTGILPSKWLARYAPLAKIGEANPTGIRFKRTQGLLLNAWLTDEKNLKADPGFRKYQAQIKSFQGVKLESAPQGFRGKLRTYQKEGLAWFEFIKTFEVGGVLADDMGLGKTVQFLAFLKKRKLDKKRRQAPSIVVVPKSLVFNWVEEASRFVPDLRVLNYTGTDRTQHLKAASKADLIITTYATLRLDIEDLRKLQFDIAVLDEAQAIKNPEAQTSIACKLLNAQHRYAMTGTPVENSMEDLFSILDFTSPSLLNLPKDQDWSTAAPEMLGKALRPLILRRTKEGVLKELPKKTEQTLYCELSPEETRRYNQLKSHFQFKLKDQIKKSGWGRSKIQVLEALLRLRQAACHPGLIDKTKSSESSSKLDTLIEQLQEVIQEGHKALVFSQFTSFLSIVRKRLEKEKIVHEYLDGKTQDRQSRVNRFQTDKSCPVFLISLKAGGTGLNLTQASYVFILDPWWNPAVESQAIDRTHRMGQTQKVFAYKMIARGTIEEKILELQKTKRQLAQSVVTESAGFLKKMTREDLEMLLS